MMPAKIGILMLDTRFPRYPGDIGNPASFDFSVEYHIVPGATPDAIVQGDQTLWLDEFVSAGRTLVEGGCKGLATTCGFLTLARDVVASECNVPVVASALEMVSSLVSEGHRPGILTISAASLTQRLLSAANVPNGIPVQGVDESGFARSILSNQPDLDFEQSREELVAGARQLCDAHPDVTAIVLECTNMPPHGRAIREAVGRPTISILDAVEQMHSHLT